MSCTYSLSNPTWHRPLAVSTSSSLAWTDTNRINTSRSFTRVRYLVIGAANVGKHHLYVHHSNINLCVLQFWHSTKIRASKIVLFQKKADFIFILKDTPSDTPAWVCRRNSSQQHMICRSILKLLLTGQKDHGQASVRQEARATG